MEPDENDQPDVDESSQDETLDAEDGSEHAREGEDHHGDEAPRLEHDAQPLPSSWDQKVALAHSLWKAGNNVRLAEVVAELEKAPEDQHDAHATAREMRRRLSPDPIAVALWLVTLGVFLLLLYLFILK